VSGAHVLACAEGSLRVHSLSGDGVKSDPKEVLGFYVCPTVGRMRLLATSGISIFARSPCLPAAGHKREAVSGARVLACAPGSERNRKHSSSITPAAIGATLITCRRVQDSGIRVWGLGNKALDRRKAHHLSRVFTLPNIGVPHYIGVPHRVTCPYQGSSITGVLRL